MVRNLVESSNQNERLNGTIIDIVQTIMMSALGVGIVAKPVLLSAPVRYTCFFTRGHMCVMVLATLVVEALINLVQVLEVLPWYVM